MTSPFTEAEKVERGMQEDLRCRSVDFVLIGEHLTLCGTKMPRHRVQWGPEPIRGVTCDRCLAHPDLLSTYRARW